MRQTCKRLSSEHCYIKRIKPWRSQSSPHVGKRVDLRSGQKSFIMGQGRLTLCWLAVTFLYKVTSGSKTLEKVPPLQFVSKTILSDFHYWKKFCCTCYWGNFLFFPVHLWGDFLAFKVTSEQQHLVSKVNNDQFSNK